MSAKKYRLRQVPGAREAAKREAERLLAARTAQPAEAERLLARVGVETFGGAQARGLYDEERG